MGCLNFFARASRKRAEEAQGLPRGLQGPVLGVFPGVDWRQVAVGPCREDAPVAVPKSSCDSRPVVSLAYALAGKEMPQAVESEVSQSQTLACLCQGLARGLYREDAV